MIEESVMFLASYGYYNGVFGEMLNEWEQMGIFSYALPFLLIFALVFGILEKVKIFKDNKAINGVIALVIGLLALQYDFVPMFFSQLFPRLGVGLSIILVILILTGLFINPKNKGLMNGLFFGSLIIAAAVLIFTSGSVGWQGGYWFYDNWKEIVYFVAFIAAIGAIIGMTKQQDENESLLARSLLGKN